MYFSGFVLFFVLMCTKATGLARLIRKSARARAALAAEVPPNGQLRVIVTIAPLDAFDRFGPQPRHAVACRCLASSSPGNGRIVAW